MFERVTDDQSAPVFCFSGFAEDFISLSWTLSVFFWSNCYTELVSVPGFMSANSYNAVSPTGVLNGSYHQLWLETPLLKIYFS